MLSTTRALKVTIDAKKTLIHLTLTQIIVGWSWSIVRVKRAVKTVKIGQFTTLIWKSNCEAINEY